MIRSRYPKSLHSYNPIPGGCALYLPLWALSGAVFRSQDPYGHICTNHNALWRPYGYYFDGDDYIDCGRNTALDVGTGDFSSGCWVELGAVVNSQHILSKGSVGAGGKRYRILYETSDDHFYFQLDDNTNETSLKLDTTPQVSTWYFLFCTADRDGNLVGYLQGVSDCTPVANTATLTIDDTTKDFCIGVSSADETSSPLSNSGRIGEVWFYRRVLSATEILHIYNVTRWRYA